MQLICLGDVAIADDNVAREVWDPPVNARLGDDLRVILNWELPIGQTKNPIPRSSGERILAHPNAPKVIQKWAPGFATLATNHILDGGSCSLLDTMSALNGIGFETVGAGRTKEQIAQPVFWETEQGRLAIVNWVFPETHPDWMAVPGPCCWPGADQATQTLYAIKRSVDWVVVVAHWSDELFPFPRPQDRQHARELARIGVDVVVGHHPHVVRGAEVIDNCSIFYSIGNFYFSDIPDGRGRWVSQQAPRNREGTGVKVTFQRGEKPCCEILSFWQSNHRVIVDHAQRGRRRMAQTSHPLREFHDDVYAKWYDAQRSRFDRWTAKYHFGLRRRGLRGTMRRLVQRITSPASG